MTFRLNLAPPGLGPNPLSDAFDDWRAAEELVAARWEQYTVAARDVAAEAYDAYVAALDAEEAAANELRQLSLDKAA